MTVFCSSSAQAAPVYFDAAAQLGAAIAQAGWGLIYGGNHIGPMAALADAARQAGGQVVGVTPQFFVDKGLADTRCNELIVCANLRDRKSIMEQRGDAFIILPGGLGTFDELFDILVARQLGLHHKPIVLVNLDGYYATLLALLDHGIQQRHIKPGVRQFLVVAGDVPQAMEYLRQFQAGRSQVPRTSD